MEFRFDLEGNIDEKLAETDKLLGAFDDALTTSGKSLAQLEDDARKLNKALALEAISKIEDPLKRQAAALSLATKEMRDQEAAAEKLERQQLAEEKRSEALAAAEERLAQRAQAAAAAREAAEAKAAQKVADARAKEDKAMAAATAELVADQAAAANAAGTWGVLSRSFGTGADSADRLDKELKRVERDMAVQAAMAERDPMKQKAALMRVYAQDLGKTDDAQKQAGVSALEFASQLSMVGSFVIQVVSKILEGIETVGRFGAAFLKAAIDANDFKQDIEGTFDTTFGTAAPDALRSLGVIADRTGMKIEDAADMMTHLGDAGFKLSEVNNIMAAAGDVSQHFGGGEKGQTAAKNLTDIIEKMRTLDKVSSKDIVGLQKAGINPDELLKTIAETKHVTQEGAQQLLEAGEVGGTEAIDAVLNTVQRTIDKGGKLGDNAIAQAAGGVAEQMNRLSNNWHSLMSTFDQGPIARVIGAVADVLKNTTDGPGARLSKLLHDVFDTLNRVFSSISAADVASAIDIVVTVLEDAWRIVKKFGETFANTLGPMLDKMGPAFEKTFGGDKTSMVEKLATAAGFLAVVIADAIGGALIVGEKMVATFEDVVAVFRFVGVEASTAFSGIVTDINAVLDYFENTSLTQIGIDLISGLWTGISQEFDALVAKVEGLAQKIPDKVKSVLGIHSPSTVMAELGVNTAEGFSVGVEKVEPPEISPPATDKAIAAVETAMPSVNAPSLGSDLSRAPSPMVAPPQVAASGDGGGGGGGGVTLTGDIYVTVQAGQGSEAASETAKQLADDFESRFRFALQRELEFRATARGEPMPPPY